ncbi:MAG TPA: endolytic transglycosylase MltG [Bacillota bacterium]|nr:endolytic transglycosylase MltG [Bacillota bacterium]
MKKKYKLLLVLLLLIGVLGIGGYSFYHQELKPPPTGGEIVVDIPKGSSLKKIASLLKENDLIRNRDIFLIHVGKLGIGGKLQAGQYQFTQGDSIDRILDRMVKGEIYDPSIQVTIPEGYTVKQIADLLSEKGLVQKDEFLKEVNEGSFDYDFVNQIPKDKKIPYRLEGYLFPKKYEFDPGTTAHAVIDRMLSQFKEEMDPDWLPSMQKEGMSLHEAVTLASIVEREVAVDKERPMVAQVYFNRIGKDINLQADATVQYALGKTKDILSFKDLEVDSPYNTYKNKGLPPGPIASPGKKSLEAVVSPQPNNFLFYVTKKDGSGEHYFSETYQEHLNKIALSKKEK